MARILTSARPWATAKLGGPCITPIMNGRNRDRNASVGFCVRKVSANMGVDTNMASEGTQTYQRKSAAPSRSAK